MAEEVVERSVDRADKQSDYYECGGEIMREGTALSPAFFLLSGIRDNNDGQEFRIRRRNTKPAMAEEVSMTMAVGMGSGTTVS